MRTILLFRCSIPSRPMMVNRKNILITGPPGIGKTTLAKKIWHALEEYAPAGFITEEIREKGVRKGFSLLSFDGKRGTLAHVNMESRFRVGKYRVDVDGLERFLVALSLPDSPSRVLIIDEIGKMECFSSMFRKQVLQLFDDGGKVVVATIAKKGEGLIADLKTRSDVILTEMTTKNRDGLLHSIVAGARESVDGC